MAASPEREQKAGKAKEVHRKTLLAQARVGTLTLFDSFEIGCCLFREDSELSTMAKFDRALRLLAC